MYSTKTSLAYFAKSALSRARSDFQRLEKTSDDETLIVFLRNMILRGDDFQEKYDDFTKTIAVEGYSISEEERTHVRAKFNRSGDEELTESAKLKEINELKVREYLPTPGQS